MSKLQLTRNQAKALACGADITIFGGGNGGGKTTGLMLGPLPHVHNGAFRAVLFMESLEKIKQLGGILDESRKFYPPAGGTVNKSNLVYTFPSGAMIKLSFVGEPGQWDGAQFAFGAIDQVEQVSSSQFFAVVSRNRSTSGVRSRMFGSCNPPPDGEEHWLTKLLDAGGYLDDEGYPVPEMDGVVRYFIRDGKGDGFLFADTADELLPRCEKDENGAAIPPYSFAFVAALVGDNPYGDPDYKRKLAILPEAERLRRLRGKWKGLNAIGIHFKEENFPLVDYRPSRVARGVRAWDNAWASSKADVSADDGPDWTVAPCMWADGDELLIDDSIRFRGGPAHLERAIHLVAELDGPDVEIRLPKDPGAAAALQGKWADRLGARGYTVVLTADQGDKLTRAQPYMACVERRQIRLCKTHRSKEVAEQLLEDFTVIDVCRGCRACRRGDMPPRCDGRGVETLVVRGLKESDVGSLQAWVPAFIREHVRFGRRGKTGKLLGKKDQVDAAVAAYLRLTDPQRQPMDDFDANTQELVELRQVVQGITGGAPHGSGRGAIGLGGGLRGVLR